MRRLKRAHKRYAAEQAKRRKKFRQRAIAAGTTAVITLGTAMGINKALADPHQLPVAHDADTDLLANNEELAIGYGVFKPDQNCNEIPDGAELAKRCAAVIAGLPSWDPMSGDPEPSEIYRIELTTFGTENCDICGSGMDMGGVQITNPKLGLSYAPGPLGESFLPFMSLHYMEHGSFSFAGTRNSGRTEIGRLLRVLELRFPHDPNEHQLPLDYVADPNVGQLAPDANDLDGDLLADSEELAAGYDLYDADQDSDLTPDGIELGKQCAAVFNQLPAANDACPNEPYKGFAEQWGLETCDICGQVVNMGGAWVTNPKLGLTVEFPILALHYMEHGSFSYAGNVNAGRVDLNLLAKALEIPTRCGDIGTIYLPNDVNKDCKIDFVDFANLADRWLQSTEPN